MKFPDLVAKLRSGLRKLQNEPKEWWHKVYEGISAGIAKWKDITNDDGSQKLSVYHCTSWCRFPFFDVDFGWGLPLLARYAAKLGKKNSFHLMGPTKWGWKWNTSNGQAGKAGNVLI